VCRFLLQALATAAALVVFVPVQLSFAADGMEQLLHETHWGESSGELLDVFGAARRLPRALDFGDSYADIVLSWQTLGGMPMVVFFQMDKATHGLKRIQLERPRHGVNPPAFRAIAAALHADYGQPDQTCVIPVLPASGYQAAAEERWARDGAVISAIFRDTTLQAFEGCLFGPATGWCGLHGQLLVRIDPPDGSADPCSLAFRRASAIRLSPWQSARRSRKSSRHAVSRSPGASGPAASNSATRALRHTVEGEGATRGGLIQRESRAKPTPNGVRE
jgi:hypothetical protein